MVHRVRGYLGDDEGSAARVFGVRLPITTARRATIQVQALGTVRHQPGAPSAPAATDWTGTRSASGDWTSWYSPKASSKWTD